MKEGIHGREIIGGLTLAALAHKAATSGCAQAEGNKTAYVGVNLSAATTPTKWTPPVQLPVVTPQATLPSSVARLGCQED